MADHGQNRFAYRAFRDHVHAPAGSNQRRIHLLFSGDPGNVNLRTFCLRLGLSYSGPPGFLWVDAKENWPHSEAVSIEAAGLRPAHRRSLHVRLAYCLSILHKTRDRAPYPEIYEPSGHDQFLGNFSLSRSRHSFSFYLRLHDRLFSGTKGILHLRLPVWRIFRSRRQVLARKNPRDGRLQPMWPLHRHVHFKRGRPRGGETIWNGC